MKYIMTDALLEIVGDHPHAGELCHPSGEEPGMITVKTMFGEKMVEVELINCKHGMKSCFLPYKNTKIIQVPAND